ncbi:hypothetical protein MP228_006739 [Amoeboaphelidium protococcarum]|nr:hypothetical protein MP228_006739 [Amoeboaphelidium protococcarum]
MKRSRAEYNNVKALTKQFLNGYEVVDCFSGLSAIYFRNKILALVKEKKGDEQYCSISQLEDIITEVLKEQTKKADDKLFVTFQGCKYFLLRAKSLLASSSSGSTARAQSFSLSNDIKLYGIEKQYLKYNSYFAVSRVSPCSASTEEQAKLQHFKVLDKLLEIGLQTTASPDNKAFFYKKKLSQDVRNLAEWKSVKDAARKAKGANSKTVLIWNSAAGFSENLDVLSDASLCFDYLAYFDWEVDAAVLNQKVSFVEGKELAEFLVQFMRILDKARFKQLSNFWSMDQFKRTCKQADVPELSTRFQPVVQFLSNLIESLVQIKLRTSSRGRLIWKALVDVKPDDADDFEDQILVLD